MLLCAGLGTRLRPLSDECPKPLVPVGDRPALLHALEQLTSVMSDGAELSSIVINVHHLPASFEERLASLGGAVQLVHEPTLRGTAGGIAGARALLEPPVLVWNGDILTRPPLRELLAAASTGGVVLAVQPRERGTGPVGLDALGRVVRLRQHVFGLEVSGADYIGVAALGREALAALPSAGCLIGDFGVPWLRQGGRIDTRLASEPWFDIGALDGYVAANRAWQRTRLDLDARGNWLGANARVSQAVELSESLLGAGAQVLGSGSVLGCILWPGAVAQAPLANAVVTPAGSIACLL